MACVTGKSQQPPSILAICAEHELKRTKGLAVCLAQPKNRRFAGLGCESNRE